MTGTSRHGRAAAASEVRDIVGPLDDNVIVSIVTLGATREEILEAMAWLSPDDYLHRDLHHALHGRATQVFDILEAELPESDRQRSAGGHPPVVPGGAAPQPLMSMRG